MKLIMTTGVIYTGGGIYTICGFAQDKDANTLFFETGVDYNDFDALTFYRKYPYETENTDCFPSYVPLPDMESYVVDSFSPDTTEYRKFWTQICQFCKDTNVQDVGDAIRNELIERLVSEYGTVYEDKENESMNELTFENTRGYKTTLSRSRNGMLTIKATNGNGSTTLNASFTETEVYKIARLVCYMKDSNTNNALLPGWTDMESFHHVFDKLIDNEDLLEFGVLGDYLDEGF